MSVRADNPCLRYIECGDDWHRTGGCHELHCQIKMSQTDIATKREELKLVFGKMDGLATAQAIENNPKLYLAFDRGILWRAVVLNPWCKEGQCLIGFVLAGPLDGVVGSSVAEKREADRKVLAKEVERKEEERRKWQSRAQKHLDDLASYKAYVKTNYGPRLTGAEKEKAAVQAEASGSKDKSEPEAIPPRAQSAGVSAFLDFCNQMQAYMDANEQFGVDQPPRYVDWPTSRFILKTIKKSEAAAWYMVDLMGDHWSGPEDATKIISMWMDFFESGREGLAHGAARSAFKSLEKLKTFISEAKELLATYPKKAFIKARLLGQVAKNAASKGAAGLKDRFNVEKSKFSPKKGWSGYFKKVWAPFKRGANGVKRLWKNVWEGDSDYKGKFAKVVASVTLLPLVSVAAFCVNFCKKPTADDEGVVKEPVPAPDEERVESTFQPSWLRSRAEANIRERAESVHSTQSIEVERVEPSRD